MTNRQFDKIDPNIADLTTFNSPLIKARIAMINSTALPNVALRSPPNASPTRRASSSVANPRRAAKGTMAKKEQTKMTVED